MENKNLNILVVEDDSMSRTLISIHLKKHFDNFEFARNFDEALLHIKEKPVDLAFLDMDLKHTDHTGINLIQPLKETRENVKIIMISGFTEQNKLGEEKGAHASIKKGHITDGEHSLIQETLKKVGVVSKYKK